MLLDLLRVRLRRALPTDRRPALQDASKPARGIVCKSLRRAAPLR
jgi:hypothetical protein